MDSEGITLELGIDDLASFEDTEETTAAQVPVYKKQECDVIGFGMNTSFIGNPVALRNSLSEECHDEDMDMENGQRILALHSSASHHSGFIGGHGDESGSAADQEDGWISPLASPVVNNSSSQQPSFPIQASSPTASMGKQGSKVGFAGADSHHPSTNANNNSTGHPPFPPISRSATNLNSNNLGESGLYGNNNHGHGHSQGQGHGQGYGNNHNYTSNSGNSSNNKHALPQLTNNNSNNVTASTTSLKVRKAPNEAKKIKQLVAVIKQAKDGAGGANVDDILHKWGTISKF